MTKKILHLVYSMGCGGLEKVIVNLINASKDYPCEHIIVTLTADHELVSLIDGKVSVYCVNKKPGKDLHCYWRLFKLFRQLQPDVINTYNFGTIEYQIVAKIAGIHLGVHSDHGRGGDDSLGKNKRNNVVRRFMSRFIDVYVVVSKDLYSWVKNDVRIKSKQIKIVQNGVALENYAERRNLTTAFTFCTVGRLDEIKNQTLMIKAYHQALETCPEMLQTKLQLVGDGPMRGVLKALVASLQLENNVELMGYREDIANILSMANAFVLSSNYEAMPMTILEAMASHVPVVTTDVGGIRHFISDQEASFVESGNEQLLAKKFIDLYLRPKNYHTKINKAYKLVSDNYSLQSMCKTYMDIYEVDTPPPKS
jgi:sugar transferase (PEP-CTERM/EpsH1 system associated)